MLDVPVVLAALAGQDEDIVIVRHHATGSIPSLRQNHDLSTAPFLDGEDGAARGIRPEDMRRVDEDPRQPARFGMAGISP